MLIGWPVGYQGAAGGQEGKSMNKTELRIRELLVEQLDGLEGKNPEDIQIDDLEALGLNSLAAVAIMKVLSKEFNTEIPMAKAQHFRSVQDLVDYLEANAD